MNNKFLLCALVILFTIYNLIFPTQELQAKEIGEVSNLEIENDTTDSKDFFESDLDVDASELFDNHDNLYKDIGDESNTGAALPMFDYFILMQAPELFPAEMFYTKILLDKDGKNYFYMENNLLAHKTCKHSKYHNSFKTVYDENYTKPIIHSVDMVWYSIIENKAYSLVQEFPYEKLKEQVEYFQNNELSGDVLLKIAPHGLVDLYVIDQLSYDFNEDTDKKVLIASYQAKEKNLSFADFKKISGFYTHGGLEAKDWDTYQINALANFPKAAEFMSEKEYVIPPKDFNFWEDIHVKEYDEPDFDTMNDLDENGETPLINAVRTKKFALFNMLIYLGADLNIQSTDIGETALTAACSMGHIQYAKSLISAGADVNLPELKSGKTPLMQASMAGHREIVDLLIKAGADVNVKQFIEGQYIGYNALKYAQENNYQEIADMLVQAGAQEIVDNEENSENVAPIEPTTIDNAVMLGDVAQVEKMLAQGEDPNKEIPGLGSLLYYACAVSNIDIVKALINANADLNAISPIGYTPLMMAVTNGQVEIVKVLLEAGADINVESPILDEETGKDVLSMAKNLSQTEIFDLISSYKDQ